MALCSFIECFAVVCSFVLYLELLIDFILDDQISGDAVKMRRQYWKLDEARNMMYTNNEKSEHGEGAYGRPVTCLLHPGLTPSKLYDHLKSHGASDACILEWTRRLQTLRQETDKKPQTYGIKLLGED